MDDECGSFVPVDPRLILARPARNKAPGQLKLSLAEGGTPRFVRVPSASAAGYLEFDGASTLVFASGRWIAEVDLESGRFAYIATDYYTDLAIWDGQIYWTVRDPFVRIAEGEWGGIRRLPTDSAPAFTVTGTWQAF